MPQILTPETASPKTVSTDRKRRGFILITHTLMIGITIGFVGLAVDAGTMYVIKGRLSSAVDAAALAAGRSLNLGNTLSAAQTAATTTATQFFAANFPAGYLGAGTPTVSVPAFVDETDANGNPSGILDIAVSASVPAPTYFIRVLNAIPLMSAPNSVLVSATGTATRRGTVMVLVLDTSTSMNNPNINPSPCTQMIAATREFIKSFSPYDYVGAVQFGYTASLVYKPVTTFGGTGAGSLDAALAALSCGTNTNTTSGLWLGYEQIKGVGLPLAYNSIVLFTDGSPNGISANFPVRIPAQADSRYGPDATGAVSCTLNTLCAPKMPAPCTVAGTVTGTIAQGAGQTNTGVTDGLWPPLSTDPTPEPYPATCPQTVGTQGFVNTLPGNNIRQVIAYIPDFDVYGNSTHGVPVTSTPTSICPGSKCTVATVTLGSTGASYTYDTRDFWEFQANDVCPSATDAGAVAACASDATPGKQYEGGVWSSFPTADPSQSNFFPASNTFYKGFMRPDQPNTIVAATMNTAMAEAYWIRADASGCGGAGGNGTVCPTLFHPVINTIYLLGNAGDAADHEFLPIMSNIQTIPALPYDNASWGTYTNPAYQANQESGLYQVTADPTELSTLFAKLASEVLRLSH